LVFENGGYIMKKVKKYIMKKSKKLDNMCEEYLPKREINVDDEVKKLMNGGKLGILEILDVARQKKFPDIKIKMVGECKDGKKIGTWKCYFDNGRVLAIIKFEDDNPISGTVITYYDDGCIDSSWYYKDGKLTLMGEFF